MKIDWQVIKLGDLGEYINGKTFKSSEWRDQGLPIIRIQNLNNERAQFNYSDFSTEDRYHVYDGDILISWSASLGIYVWNRGHALLNQHIFKVILNEHLIDRNYFIYLIRTKLEEMTSKTHGATMKHIVRSKFLNIEAQIPPLPEQKRIVKLLDKKMEKLREAKKLREEAIKDTEKILSQTLHEIFEEGQKKGWEEKKIGNVFTFNYGKGISRLERSENGKYFAYGANGPLGRTDKFLIEGENIIVGRKGSAGEVTRVSGRLWPTDVTYFITENNKYDINFAFYLFKYLNFTQYAKGVKPGINRNEIYSLTFNLPHLSEQKQIVKRLNSLSTKIRVFRELQTSQLEDLKKLEKAYLREAFNGEL